MKASELRDSGGKEDFNRDQLQGVFDYLKVFASKGKTSASIAADLYPKSLFEHLKTLEYKVELVSDNRDGNYYNIDWSE